MKHGNGTRSSGTLRYDFASDFDGDKCLIAPAGTEDWYGWRVQEVGADGTWVECPVTPGRFGGYVHRDAEASWYIPASAGHVEVRIPGEAVLTIHPYVPQPGATQCPVCGYDGPEAWPDPRVPSLLRRLRQRWASHQGRRIRGAFLGGEPAGWPDSTDARCDLRAIDFRAEDLAGRDLSLTRLDWANLDGASVAGADLSASSLRGATFVGAKLDHARLVGVDARRANFSGAELTRVDARSSNLTLSRFWKALLRSSNFDHACLMGADLRVADLRGSSVRGCDFEGALLTCAKFDALGVADPWVHVANEVGAPSFGQVLPRYLDALQLQKLSAPWHVEAALASSDDAELEVTNLVRQEDWRMAIVGVLAVAIGAPCRTELLWERLREKSFIDPQIAVTLKLRDPEFGHRVGFNDRALEFVDTSSSAAIDPETNQGRRIAARWLGRISVWMRARERNAHPAVDIEEIKSRF